MEAASQAANAIASGAELAQASDANGKDGVKLVCEAEGDCASVQARLLSLSCA